VEIADNAVVLDRQVVVAHALVSPPGRSCGTVAPGPAAGRPVVQSHHTIRRLVDT
jgi:hypothetical protein